MNLQEAYLKCRTGTEEERDNAWHEFISLAMHDMAKKQQKTPQASPEGQNTLLGKKV